MLARQVKLQMICTWSALCIVVALIGAACFVAGMRYHGGGRTEDRRFFVRSDEIPRVVRIMGTLEKPLGTLMTIRGQWIAPEQDAKDSTPAFVVTHVDGEALKRSVKMGRVLVRHFDFYPKGRSSNRGGSWDWRGGPDGDNPPPEAAAGEKWELLGVQEGHYDDLSMEAWAEFTGIPLPQPSDVSGFHCHFIYVAMRRL